MKILLLVSKEKNAAVFHSALCHICNEYITNRDNEKHTNKLCLFMYFVDSGWIRLYKYVIS